MTAVTPARGPIDRRRGRERVAVVGSGVAGLTAAYILQRRYDVSLYEADDRLGGHAHTHDVLTPDRGVAAIDTGFIVHNARTYPHLLRLFSELDVATQPTEMSMSIRCEGCGLEYAGAKGWGGLFAQPRSVVRPAYLRMLTEVKKFHRNAERVLEAGDDSLTLGQFLTDGRFSAYFVQHFMVPLVACVWSTSQEAALGYPARYLFSFLANHGMLTVTGSPQWRTVVGGSRSYVEKAVKELTSVRLATPVRSIHRDADGVTIRDADGGASHYRHAVIATHADTALQLLAEPTETERAVLGAVGYSDNHTVLHTSKRMLPTSVRANASWNYLMPTCATSSADVIVSYDMNRLQQLDTATPYVVSLNASDRIDPHQIVAEMDYQHPIYTVEGGHRTAADARAQRRCAGIRRRLPGLGLPRGRLPLRRRGRAVVRSAVVSTATTYRTVITHARQAPLSNRFRYRTGAWLVDLDQVPQLPRGMRWLATFESRDHLGTPTASLRDNLIALLATHDIDLAGGRIVMLANARALGHAFNPISIHWCYDAGDGLVAVVAEVHNTYGDRHAYVLAPDAAGQVDVRLDKAMYVSPFNPVDGQYRITVSPPADRVSVAVTLTRTGQPSFVATLVGERQPPRSVVAAAVGTAATSLRVSALIRWQGVRLFLRGLRVEPRPVHTRQEAV